MSQPAWIPPVPYPAEGRHGIIGDRRTAALVAADGTIDWLCLPDYDGDIVFGALLDAEMGGYWRLGPAAPRQGRQDYLEETAALVTTWSLDGSGLELTDAMAWPATQRPPGQESQRILPGQSHSIWHGGFGLICSPCAGVKKEGSSQGGHDGRVHRSSF